MDLQKYVNNGIQLYNNRPVRKPYQDKRAMTARIREVLVDKPMSQQEIADKLGVRKERVQGSIGMLVKHGDAERVKVDKKTGYRRKQ